jgi:sucrose-6F-phosphate phosphohydrolase
MGIRRLVVTDLDGTLLGDVPALRRFDAWLSRDRESVLLAYATGRHPEEIQAAVREEGLPVPDVVIAAVGTEIADRWQGPWQSWAERFDPAHGDRVRAAFGEVTWLELQPAIHQSSLKASYHVSGLSPADLAFLERRVAGAGVEARLIYSGGRFLDVLPKGSGKAAATRFVARALGLPDARVLTFGDSGNDLDLLSVGFSATVVANALPEVHEALGPAVYRSPYAFADGVLDGIRHWTREREVSGAV